MSRWAKGHGKAALYAGFAATGVAMTIPGAVLPLLLRRWSMSDAKGGLLLFCFYAMGSVGSYIARGKMNLSIARGAFLVAAGALCLAAAGRWMAYGAIAVYGMGLSLTMTSISLLLSHRFPKQRRLELTRLNLIWAVGAALGPWIALRSTEGRKVTEALGILHTQRVLVGVAMFSLLAAAWALWIEKDPLTTAAGTSGASVMRLRGKSGIREIPWPLLVLIFGATGIDAAAGGWLTSYAQRAGDSLGIMISAATFLWLGALASRLVHSTPWAARLPERYVLAASMLAMCSALALLIAWPAGAATMVAAAVLGLASGPVYPLVLAAALRHKENSTIFAIAGVGAALMPLATGAVSTWAHSLRAGLSVPLLAAMAMSAVVALSGSTLKDGREVEAGSMIAQSSSKLADGINVLT